MGRPFVPKKGVCVCVCGGGGGGWGEQVHYNHLLKSHIEKSIETPYAWQQRPR